jgi:flagellar biogenesis protein FliO
VGVRRTSLAIATALLLAGALLGVVDDATAQESAAPAGVAGSAPAPVAPDLTPLPGTAENGAAPVKPAAGVSTGDFVRMVVVLAAVLGAIYLLVLLIKRASPGRVGDSDRIAVLGSRSLGGSRSLHLVRVGSGMYLVGATDQALNLIAEVTDQEVDAVAPNHSHANGTRRGFAHLLADIGAADSGTDGTAGGSVTQPAGRRGTLATAGFLRHQQARLQRLRRRRHQGEDDARD